MTSRNYCFTYFTSDEGFRIEPESRIVYCIYQFEKCPTTSKVHVQGYVQLSTPMRIPGVQKLLKIPGAHLERGRGSPLDNKVYCSKEETRMLGPYEFGRMNVQGQRNDIKEFVESVAKGASDISLIDEFPNQICKYMKVLPFIRNAVIEPRNWQTEVIVLVGPPGCGKTSYAYREYDNIYVKPDGDWFDGYVGQSTVLFDDYNGHIKYELLLKLLDRYQMKVPVKGSFIEWSPRTVIITSNLEMEYWYRDRHEIDALKRRVTKVINYFKKENLVDILLGDAIST